MARFKKGKTKVVAPKLNYKSGPGQRQADSTALRMTRRGKQSKYGTQKRKMPGTQTIKGI